MLLAQTVVMTSSSVWDIKLNQHQLNLRIPRSLKNQPRRGKAMRANATLHDYTNEQLLFVNAEVTVVRNPIHEMSLVTNHSKNKTSFWGMPVSGVQTKRGWYVFWLFFKIALCSDVSFNRSRRELSNDVAEHWSILKNKGVVRILVIFQDSPMFRHIIQTVSVIGFHWCG